MPINPYEAAKREEKAGRIARALRDAGATVELAEALEEGGRALVEQAAAVKPSSDETWKLAITKLRRMLEWKTDPLAVPDDPFEGLPGSSAERTT